MAIKLDMAEERSGGRRRRRRSRPVAEINVTPFVDVMLVLLIVFMVAAPLLTVGVDVDLPYLQRINFDHLMLDHAAAHISVIFYRVTVNRHLARPPEFFFQDGVARSRHWPKGWGCGICSGRGVATRFPHRA